MQVVHFAGCLLALPRSSQQTHPRSIHACSVAHPPVVGHYRPTGSAIVDRSNWDSNTTSWRSSRVCLRLRRLQRVQHISLRISGSSHGVVHGFWHIGLRHIGQPGATTSAACLRLDHAVNDYI